MHGTDGWNTHPEYVILITFPLQQWLYGRTLMSRYTYVDCIVCSVHFCIQTGISEKQVCITQVLVSKLRIYLWLKDREMHTGVWWGKPKEDDSLEDRSIDGRILKWIFSFFSQLYRASWCYQNLLFTNWCTIELLQKNIKIYIKTVPTCFGSITIIRERIIWAC